MKRICDVKECTACGLCIAKCPYEAISLTYKGTNVYAAIDREKCVECGLCKKTCPGNSPLNSMNKPMHCYVSWSKKALVRRDRSSGGAIYEISYAFIKDGGCVVTLKWEKDKMYGFGIYESIEELTDMPNSIYAYVPMQREDYHVISNIISKGKKVLFVGLPCQVDAVNRFVGLHSDNLFTIDLICSGCGSMRLLKSHLDSVADRYERVSFRGRHNFKLTVYEGDQVEDQGEYGNDSFCKLFTRSIGFREACYHCRYTIPQRSGDLTVGDFWGLNKAYLSEYEQAKGVNAILVNSEKGSMLLNYGYDRLELQRRTIEEAVNGNARLNHCAEKSWFASRFATLIIFLGFYYASRYVLMKEESKK